MRATAMVLLACAMVALGCKGGGSPKSAFESWLKAVEKCDVAGIKAGLTKESVEQLDALMKQFAAFVPADKQKDFDIYKEICKGFKPGSIQVLAEEVAGDSATLKIKSGEKEDKAPMRQEDGVWKIDFAALMKEGLRAAPASAAPATENAPTGEQGAPAPAEAQPAPPQ